MITEKQENFAKRAAKGILWWIAADIICLIFNMCMIPFMIKFMAVRIFTALSSAIILNGLLFNYTYNCAVKDRNLIKYHHAAPDGKMALKLALFAPLPQYILWIVLLLSKAGVIGDIFRYYVLANIQCLAWVDLFTSSREITAVTAGGLAGLLLLTLVTPAVIAVTYELTLREIDVKSLILYGKKGK